MHGGISSRRIVATWMKRVAAADTFDPAEASSNGSVLLDGANEISAARGLKATAVAGHPAQKPLIETDHQDQHQRRNRDQKSDGFHESLEGVALFRRLASCGSVYRKNLSSKPVAAICRLSKKQSESCGIVRFAQSGTTNHSKRPPQQRIPVAGARHSCYLSHPVEGRSNGSGNSPLRISRSRAHSAAF